MFDLSNAKRVNVEPSQLLSVLLGIFDDTLLADWSDSDSQGWLLVHCEGTCVAIVEFFIGEDCMPDLKLKAIHCDRPVHGVHRRLAESDAYKRVLQYFKRGDSVCERCGGECWIDIDCPEGRQLIMMADSIKMFRGIRLAENGYRSEQLQPEGPRDMFVSFLSGNHPHRTSAAGRAGKSQPDLFPKKTKRK
ncbi:MAG: hypothetical protein KAV87_53165 [Desulfobacteraceae bacterium]|nr:hypothetical protein [Desulfobacteraceae bacterium]